MMNDNQLWELIRDTEGAIVRHFEPVFERFNSEQRLDTWGVGLLLAAITFEPDPITASRLSVRGPYTSISAYRKKLAEIARKGYLLESRPAEYRLSAKGRQATEKLITEVRQRMANADPLPAKQGKRIGNLLTKLVKTSLDTPKPPDTWSIRLSFTLMPKSAPALPYIEQAISCLSAYRDDAHLAAWRQTGLSALALECLTLIWRNQADSMESLLQKLARRGHTPKSFREALIELRERGLINSEENNIQITAQGRTMRDQIETDTDRYFFHPWSCLDTAEKAELGASLTALRDGLNSKAVQPT